MSRETFLLIFREHTKTPVPAHWSMFIPSSPTDSSSPTNSTSSTSSLGDLFQALGTPLTGYTVEHKTFYNPSSEPKPPLKISLGSIDEKWLSQLDAKAKEVKAPGVSTTV
ncbi:hypothetical protein M7I_5290 [Glarea lozoyensis 74030]|uniref:Uncharacterized protein n=1 Tax=Glarea lozoyensis (strain ATCC 74030 / MF5533) TaxID=1104152 RepID=H0ERH1_GLAL7|nr:hypothetical protein M7I_5290 [Glarea lozoyensis 74030]